MKNYNRRDFLKLTGMSALALTLAACGGPSAPAAPTKAQTLFAAINASRKEKGLKELKYDNDMEAFATFEMKCFEAQGKPKIAMDDFNKWVESQMDDYLALLKLS